MHLEIPVQLPSASNSSVISIVLVMKATLPRVVCWLCCLVLLLPLLPSLQPCPPLCCVHTGCLHDPQCSLTSGLCTCSSLLLGGPFLVLSAWIPICSSGFSSDFLAATIDVCPVWTKAAGSVRKWLYPRCSYEKQWSELSAKVTGMFGPRELGRSYKDRERHWNSFSLAVVGCISLTRSHNPFPHG